MAGAQAFEEHPDAPIIRSFPGLGSIPGARILAEIGDDRTRFTNAGSLKAYDAGSAPVTRASGKSCVVRDSVRPVYEAGLLDLVDVPLDLVDVRPESPDVTKGAEVAPGVRLQPTPGHTPGQVAVELRSAGRSAVITGDCVHHPVQLHDPDITSCVDIDAAEATRSRRALLSALADSDVLLLGSHFPPPTAGRVVSEGGHYKFVPAQ